ncbi:MAG: hypothetical protein Q8O55_08795 [Dehalococcoidales bacterium]|nr:hypothetical protein [Dehalococcoidales bacterium]
MPKCIPCLGKDIKDAIREAISDEATLALVDKVKDCPEDEAMEFCGKLSKRAPSPYQAFVGICLKGGEKTISDCAGEWRERKANGGKPATEGKSRAEEEKFVCNLERIEPLESYFSIEYGPKGECRPCRVKPLAQLYKGALEDKGLTQQVGVLDEVYETGDILTIARAMDNIKANTEDKGLKSELENLDCFVQSFKDEV